MSKGSPIVNVRMPQEQLELLHLVIADLNKKRPKKKWIVTSFILDAISRRIKELNRGRRYTAAMRVRKTESVARKTAELLHTIIVADSVSYKKGESDEPDGKTPDEAYPETLEGRPGVPA